MSKPTSAEAFTIIATGEIEGCEIPGVDNAYCKWGVAYGEDWAVLNGLEEGITQTARRGRGASPVLIWNFPLDMTFKATNAFGWPKLHFSVYGRDGFMGSDIIQGYGFIHVPTCPGRYTLPVRLFKPKNKTLITSFQSWVSRNPAEFKRNDHVCQSEGREVTSVMSNGFLTVTINVVSKNMAVTGYDDGSSLGATGITTL